MLISLLPLHVAQHTFFLMDVNYCFYLKQCLRTNHIINFRWPKRQRRRLTNRDRDIGRSQSILLFCSSPLRTYRTSTRCTNTRWVGSSISMSCPSMTGTFNNSEEQKYKNNSGMIVNSKIKLELHVKSKIFTIESTFHLYKWLEMYTNWCG